MDIEKAYLSCGPDEACRQKVKDSANALSQFQDLQLTWAKAKCLVGSCQDLEKIQRQVAHSGNINLVYGELKARYPDASDAELKAAAQIYSKEAYDSYEKGTTRLAVGVLDSLPALNLISMGGTSAVRGVGRFLRQSQAVPASEIGMLWGKGNMRQGMPWENYVGKNLPADARLPANFKTFDYYDGATRTAISAKTLDTQTASRLNQPQQIYSTLKRHIDDAGKFESHSLSGFTLNPKMIQNREIHLAVPAQTTSVQRLEINRAIEYGNQKGIKVIVTEIK